MADQSCDFGDIVGDMGKAGAQLTQLDAAEGSAGNLSVYVPQLHKLDSRFIERGELSLPLPVPGLVEGWLLVTGAGRRLRDVSQSPLSSLVVLRISPGGERATCYSAIDLNPTSELNSHLAVHADQASRAEIRYHAVVHAQPFHLTFLSHLPGYADKASLNRRLVRWGPETLIVFPEGIGMIPYLVTGSSELMHATASGLRAHRLVVWQKHGVVAHSPASAVRAADLVEYAETAARYELENLRLGSPAVGLTDDQILELCERFGADADLFL